MIKAKPTAVAAAVTCNAAFGASTSPGAAPRMLSTQTTMASHNLHCLGSRVPATPTRQRGPARRPLAACLQRAFFRELLGEDVPAEGEVEFVEDIVQTLMRPEED
jgi:hypothetical protein